LGRRTHSNRLARLEPAVTPPTELCIVGRDSDAMDLPSAPAGDQARRHDERGVPRREHLDDHRVFCGETRAQLAPHLWRRSRSVQCERRLLPRLGCARPEGTGIGTRSELGGQRRQGRVVHNLPGCAGGCVKKTPMARGVFVGTRRDSVNDVGARARLAEQSTRLKVPEEEVPIARNGLPGMVRVVRPELGHVDVCASSLRCIVCTKVHSLAGAGAGSSVTFGPLAWPSRFVA